MSRRRTSAERKKRAAAKSRAASTSTVVAAAKSAAAPAPSGAAAAEPAASASRSDAVASSSAVGRPKRRRWVPWFLLGAAFAGFVLSMYLTLVHYRGYVSPCFVVHGCEQVQTSRYSVVLGIPVALLGTVFFGLMFYLAIGVLTRSASVRLVRVYKVLAFVGALAMIPLFLLQAIVLKAFCSYCVATEVIMLSIWIVSFLLTPRGEGHRRTEDRRVDVTGQGGCRGRVVYRHAWHRARTARNAASPP